METLSLIFGPALSTVALLEGTEYTPREKLSLVIAERMLKRDRFERQNARTRFITSCARTSRILCSKIVILPSVLSKTKQAKQVINLLLLDKLLSSDHHRRRVRNDNRRIILYTVFGGHSLWSAISCQRNWLISTLLSQQILPCMLRCITFIIIPVAYVAVVVFDIRTSASTSTFFDI